MARFTKKKKTIALLTAGLVLTGGAAFAYWTNSGTGAGTAATGTTVAVTVNQTNAAVTGLFPGGPAGALSGTFTNPNAGPVAVGVVTAAVTATDTAGCLTAWYQIVGTAAPAAQTIASGVGVGTWSGLSVQLLNDAANQDVCKNAVITISYSVPAGA